MNIISGTEARLYEIDGFIIVTPIPSAEVSEDRPGKFEVVKNRLKEYVESAVGGTVSNNWRLKIYDIGTFPLSTIRFEQGLLHDLTYSTRMPEWGCWILYEFSIYVHEKSVSTYLDTTPKFYLAMDDADLIVDELISKNEDDDEKTNYGIYQIYDITLDFEQPSGRAKNMGRMEVRGRLRAKWLY
jgi:hypothetical protein